MQPSHLLISLSERAQSRPRQPSDCLNGVASCTDVSMLELTSTTSSVLHSSPSCSASFLFRFLLSYEFFLSLSHCLLTASYSFTPFDLSLFKLGMLMSDFLFVVVGFGCLFSDVLLVFFVVLFASDPFLAGLLPLLADAVMLMYNTSPDIKTILIAFVISFSASLLLFFISQSSVFLSLFIVLSFGCVLCSPRVLASFLCLLGYPIFALLDPLTLFFLIALVACRYSPTPSILFRIFLSTPLLNASHVWLRLGGSLLCAFLEINCFASLRLFWMSLFASLLRLGYPVFALLVPLILFFLIALVACRYSPTPSILFRIFLSTPLLNASHVWLRLGGSLLCDFLELYCFVSLRLFWMSLFAPLLRDTVYW
jgi:hypothetical protein